MRSLKRYWKNIKNFEKDNISKLENRIEPSTENDKYSSHWLSLIQKAITNTNVLQIEYYSIYKEENTKRNIEPLAIYFTKNAWILVAFCRLRKEEREFRLDRILKLITTLDTFKYQQNFSLKKYIEKYNET